MRKVDTLRFDCAKREEVVLPQAIAALASIFMDRLLEELDRAAAIRARADQARPGAELPPTAASRPPPTPSVHTASAVPDESAVAPAAPVPAAAYVTVDLSDVGPEALRGGGADASTAAGDVLPVADGEAASLRPSPAPSPRTASSVASRRTFEETGGPLPSALEPAELVALWAQIGFLVGWESLLSTCASRTNAA